MTKNINTVSKISAILSSKPSVIKKIKDLEKKLETITALENAIQSLVSSESPQKRARRHFPRKIAKPGTLKPAILTALSTTDHGINAKTILRLVKAQGVPTTIGSIRFAMKDLRDAGTVKLISSTRGNGGFIYQAQ